MIFTKSLSRIDLDPVNLKILEVLSAGEKGSGAISKSVSLSRQAAVERLRNLRTLGFIQQEGEGPKTVYKLSKSLS